MKFLSKLPDSRILAEKLVYELGGDNRTLRRMLLEEQSGFCAYTEKYLEAGCDSCDVEHFDASKKGNDDYFNYYATLHSANMRKRGKDKKHAGARFFTSLFFHDRRQLANRVRYVPGEYVYEEAEGDSEAEAFIDYLGLNDPELVKLRKGRIGSLRDLFAPLTVDQRLAHLSKYPHDLSFPTVLEAELGLDLSRLIPQRA